MNLRALGSIFRPSHLWVLLFVLPLGCNVPEGSVEDTAPSADSGVGSGAEAASKGAAASVENAAEAVGAGAAESVEAGSEAVEAVEAGAAESVEAGAEAVEAAAAEGVAAAKGAAEEAAAAVAAAAGAAPQTRKNGTGAGTDQPRTGAAADSARGQLEYVVPKGAENAVKVFPMVKDEWRIWGGNPSRNMVNPFAKNISASWDVEKGTHIKWKQALGSQTYGNTVIAEGKVLVGTNNDRKRDPAIQGDKGVIMCFQEDDGKFLWQLVHDKLAQGRVNDWPEQGICSSPAIIDGLVYYVSNRCEVVCADLDGLADGNEGIQTEKYKGPEHGDIVWSYDMLNELGVFPHNLATCSPLIVGDLVLVITANGVERDHLTIPSPRSPSFLALDRKTGKLLWDENYPGEDILHGQWSNPAYGVAGGREQVIFPGGDGWVYSLEPKTGKLIWKFDCNPKDSKWELGGLGTRNSLISTPVFYDDSVYIAVGQDPEHGEGIGNLFRIKADGQGDVTDTHKVWAYGGEDFRRTISTVAIDNGLVFAADLSGFLHCLDQNTGKPYWVHDLLAAVWGSPTVIDGKVYIGDEDGDIFICKASKKLEKIAEIPMDNSVYSTAVAAKGILYISDRSTLYAIEKK